MYKLQNIPYHSDRSRHMTSRHMILFINVKSSISNRPLSVPQTTILCSTFISPFSLSKCKMPTLLSLPSKSEPTGSKFLLLRFVKNKVLLSVHTFPLGKLLPPWNSLWAPASKFSYVILQMIFLLCILPGFSSLFFFITESITLNPGSCSISGQTGLDVNS